MEISYLNKEIALVRAIDCNDDEPVDMDAIISAMASATNEKRRIDLLRMIPFKFGKELMCLNCGDENLADLGIGKNEDARVKTTLNQWFPAIQHLDLELIESGALGKLKRDKQGKGTLDALCAKVELEGNYHLIQCSEFDTLAHNGRLLLSMAAFFNGAEGATSPLDISGEDDNGYLIDTGLLVSEYTQKCPLQPNLGEMSDSLIKTAKKLKYSLKRHITTPEGTYAMVLPRELTEQERCIEAFAGFLNAFDYSAKYEGDGARHNTFTLERKNGSLQMQERTIQVEALYRRVAEIALNSDVALCSYCGSPIITSASRGKPIRFCSGSCCNLSYRSKKAH